MEVGLMKIIICTKMEVELMKRFLCAIRNWIDKSNWTFGFKWNLDWWNEFFVQIEVGLMKVTYSIGALTLLYLRKKILFINPASNYAKIFFFSPISIYTKFFHQSNLHWCKNYFHQCSFHFLSKELVSSIQLVRVLFIQSSLIHFLQFIFIEYALTCSWVQCAQICLFQINE